MKNYFIDLENIIQYNVIELDYFNTKILFLLIKTSFDKNLIINEHFCFNFN
jgi:hypothetical protein